MRWTDQVYRRFSVDIHVPDWDPALLSHFDAAAYVDCMMRGGIQSLLQYTNSHVGLCLWRTEIGQRHANMGERDFFGEVVRACRDRGVHPLAYFSVIFDNWAYETHPDWRILPADGYESHLQGRYGVACPNSPYRDYVQACVREIVSAYDIDGMFFDMTFWPTVCYCPHCTERFRQEHGTEPPRIVDWDDPVWRVFQQARERWLLTFATQIAGVARQTRPGLTVNHQFSTIFHTWTAGVPLELAGACDYVGGDFYGGPIQHSLACKVYYGLTPTRPFEFHTSRTRHPSDHVMIKPMEEMCTEAFVATLHSAALMLVDYINADGTLNPNVYDFLGQLSARRTAYEPFLGGELLADVAIYYDKASMYNPDENGAHVTRLQAPDHCPHRDAVIGVGRILQEAHIPFGVVTNANLDQLNRYRAVILPMVLEMTEEQAAVFRAFVERGGALYASGASSLNRTGPNGPRYLLEDVLGVRYLGTAGTRISYLTPQDGETGQAIWPQDHLAFNGPMARVETLDGAQTLATVTLPFVEPELGRVIGSRFAGIHSNPPALEPGTDPAIVSNRFGQGRVVWVAAPIESGLEKANARLVSHLLRQVLPGPFRFEMETHPAVEMTLFDQPEKRRLRAALLNMQPQWPQAAVGATVRVLLPEGRRPTQVLKLPESAPMPFDMVGPYVQFFVDPFDTLAMMAVDYE